MCENPETHLNTNELIANFKGRFPHLSTPEQKECIQFVRDALVPLVGEQEVILLDYSISVETISEHLVKGSLGTPQNIADDYISSLNKQRENSSDAEKCAIDLLLGYFSSFRTAKIAIGAAVDVIETIAQDLLYCANQLALLYCSGTKKVEKYAH